MPDEIAESPPVTEKVSEVIERIPPVREAGEIPPDFSTLGKKITQEPQKEPESGKATEKEEKRATGDPGAMAGIKKDEARGKVEPKKEEKRPEGKTEPAKETKTEKAKTEKKEEAKPAEIPESDDDIDALKPHPGAPTQVVKSFEEMKVRMKTERATSRAALAEAKAAKAEAETLKASVGKLSLEDEARVKRADELLMTFEAENNESFQKEFGAKIKAAEDGIYTLLKKHGLPEQVQKEIEASAQAGTLEEWARWPELLDALKNPLQRQELIDAIKSRRDAIGAKNAKLADLTRDREKFGNEFGEREHQQRLQWAKQVEKKSIELAAKHEWLLKNEAEEDATPEAKKLNEERNTKIDGLAQKFIENVRNSYERNAEAVSEISIKALHADYLLEQNQELERDAERNKARVKELETQLAKIKNAGRMSNIPAAEAPKEDDGKTGEIGGDGASAIAAFFNKRK